jgi:hydrogenase expression/formation protein HypD
MKIRDMYQSLDAAKQFDIRIKPVPEPKGCICGEVLRGLKRPDQCRLFAGKCTPANPIGACMVSGEGACQAYFNYR